MRYGPVFERRVIDRAEGSFVYDTDGNRILNRLLSRGLLIRSLFLYQALSNQLGLNGKLTAIPRRMRLGEGSRSHPFVSNEGHGEGAGRTIADLTGDLALRQGASQQQILGKRHAPGGEVFHRRAADLLTEALEKS